MSRSSWAVLIGCLGLTPGCMAGEDGAPPDAQAGSDALGGSSGSSMNPSSGTAAAGGAGAPDAAEDAMPSGELVADLQCADLWSLEVLDDDHIFYSCFESTEQDYNLIEQFTLRQLMAGGSKLLLAGESPLFMRAMDSEAYYLEEPRTFDDNHNAWGRDLRRLPFGTTELQPFVQVDNTNYGPEILVQTDDVLAIAQGSDDGAFKTTNYFVTVRVHAKPGGTGSTLLSRTPGHVATAWLEGNQIGFVVDAPDAPAVYRGPLSGGMATPSLALPNLCHGFRRDIDGFLAVCGDTSDLVHIDEAGSLTKLAEGVAYNHLLRADRLYWTGHSLAPNPAEPSFPTVFALSDSGEMATVALAREVFIVALTSAFAYLQVRRPEGYSLRRLALAEVR